MSHNSSYDSSESEGEETMIVGEIPKDRRSLLDGSESESEEEIIVKPPVHYITKLEDLIQDQEVENVPQTEDAVLEVPRTKYVGKIHEPEEEWDWKNEKFSSDDEKEEEEQNVFNFEAFEFVEKFKYEQFVDRSSETEEEFDMESYNQFNGDIPNHFDDGFNGEFTNGFDDFAFGNEKKEEKETKEEKENDSVIMKAIDDFLKDDSYEECLAAENNETNE